MNHIHIMDELLFVSKIVVVTNINLILILKINVQIDDRVCYAFKYFQTNKHK